MSIDLSKLRRGDIVTVEMQYCSHDDENVVLRPVGAPYASPTLLDQQYVLSSRPLFTAGDDVIDDEGTLCEVRFVEGRWILVVYPDGSPVLWEDTQLRRPEPPTLAEAA